MKLCFSCAATFVTTKSTQKPNVENVTFRFRIVSSMLTPNVSPTSGPRRRSPRRSRGREMPKGQYRTDVNPARIPKQATHFVLTHATTQSAPWRYLRGHGGAPAQPVPTAVGGTKGDCWHVPRLLRAFSSARSRSSTLRASAEIGFSRYATTNSAALRISSESVTSARLRRMSQVFCNATDFPLPVAP